MTRPKKNVIIRYKLKKKSYRKTQKKRVATNARKRLKMTKRELLEAMIQGVAEQEDVVAYAQKELDALLKKKGYESKAKKEREASTLAIIELVEKEFADGREFTLGEVAEIANISIQKATVSLKRMVADGKVTIEAKIVGGKATKAYKII